ncbi:hypothetical protein Vretimale_2087 [Volvox reticuliferus]|nr:hypothetical protein Vretimale_2087 [Volvox reticuliferus]
MSGYKRATVTLAVLSALVVARALTKDKVKRFASAAVISSRAALHGELPIENRTVQRLTDSTVDFRHTCTGLHQPLERLKVHAVKQSLDHEIKITPDRLVLARGSGEWFTVSWSGVADPKYDDWIALVVPADANLTETSPSKWKFAAGDPQHVVTGSGSLRVEVAFAVMRNGFDTPVEVARSLPIKVLRPNEPLQVHLALTGDPREMRVQWNTRDAGLKPQVRWGPESVRYDGGDTDAYGSDSGPSYPFSSAADTNRYGVEDMCGGAATSVGWVDAGHHHVALMSGLKPATRFYYRVGDPNGGGGWSQEFSFLSSPDAFPDTTVYILAVADMGQAEADGSLEGSEMMPSRNTTRRMAQDATSTPYSLLLHLGDISYARGYSTQWDNFMHQIEPLAAHMPYMVAPGNHERDWPGSGDFFGVQDSGGECGVAYERRFPMPYPGKDKLWYAFAYGPIFFIHYSTEHPFGPGSEQYEFMVKTLRSVDRRRTPWLVVGGHRPIYVASTNANWPDGDQPVSQLLRDAFEDLFMAHSVDMTLQGHHHSYQRTCPLYRGACQKNNDDGTATAPLHLVIGHAGAGLSLNIVEPPPAWLKNLGLWWGYVRMKVSQSHLLVEVVGDDNGQLMDSFELRKPADWGDRYMEHKRMIG